MRTYFLQLTSFATTPGNVLAINNPANSTVRVLVRCVENAHADTITSATYRLRRFPALATGGDALALEPGDETPRVLRRDSLAMPPSFAAVTGAFVAPSGPTYDEVFTLTSREGAENSCHDLADGPLVARPGESLVLSLVGADLDIASVAVEAQEADEAAPIVPAAAPFARLIGESFAGTGALPATHWTTTASGGTATRAGGQLVVSTGAGVDGEAAVESVRLARFLTGAIHRFAAVLRLGDAGATGNVRAWGALTEDNGFGFKLDGTTMGVFERKGGVDTLVPEASWNVDAFEFGATYREWSIVYDVNRVEFWIDGVFRHSLQTATTSPRIADHDLPVRFENVNSGGHATDHTIEIVGVSIVRHGPARAASNYYHLDGSAQALTLKEGAGTLGEFLVTKAGTGGSSIQIYDGLDATGRLIADINGDALASLPFGPDGVEFNLGLHVVTSANSGKSTLTFD